MSPTQVAGIGILAGISSGLFGVGGGVVTVPLLVMTQGFSQHEAHATSLAAIAPTAAVGAVTYAIYGHVAVAIGIALAIGSLAGAPLGANLMAKAAEPTLKIAFGVLTIVLGLVIAIR